MTANITIIGHVGDSPRLDDFVNSKKASFSVGVNEYRGKDKPKVTTWYQVETWNGGTDRVVDLITKGREVVVTGQLTLNTYTSEKYGREVTKPVIRLQSFHLCGRKPEEEVDEAEGE